MKKIMGVILVMLILTSNIIFGVENNVVHASEKSKTDDFKKAYEDGIYNTNEDWSVTENFNSDYVPNDIKAYNKAATSVKGVNITVQFKEKEDNKGVAYITDKNKHHSDNKATNDLFIGKLDTNKTPTLGIFTQAGTDEGQLNTLERWNFDGSKSVGTLTITFDKEVENPILDLSGIGGYRKVFGTQTEDSKKYAKGSFSASELELKSPNIAVEKVGQGVNLQVENGKIKVINRNTYSQSKLDKGFVEDNENKDARTPDLSPAGTGSIMLIGKMKEVTFEVFHSAIPFSKFSKEQYHTGSSYFIKEEDKSKKENKKCADGVNGLNTVVTEEVCKDIFKDKGTKLYNSDLFLMSIRFAKKGSVDVKYITTENEVLEDVTDVVKDELVGKDYTTVQKNFNGYVFEKMGADSAPATGKVKEETQHVIYVYKKQIPGFPLTPAKRKISVTKEWKDAKGNVIDPSVKQIQVELYRDEKPTGNKIELKKENNWKNEFTNIPVSDTSSSKGYTYSVKEVGEQNNSVIINGNKFTVEYIGDMKKGFVIKNYAEITESNFIDYSIEEKTEEIHGENKGSVEEVTDNNFVDIIEITTPEGSGGKVIGSVEEIEENHYVDILENTGDGSIFGDSQDIPDEVTENSFVDIIEITTPEGSGGEVIGSVEEIEENHYVDILENTGDGSISGDSKDISDEITENNFVDIVEITTPDGSGGKADKTIEEITENHYIDLFEESGNDEIRGEHKGNITEIEEDKFEELLKYNRQKDQSERANDLEMLKEEKISDKSNKIHKLPKTGDASNIRVYGSLLSLSVGLLVLLGVKKRKEK